MTIVPAREDAYRRRIRRRLTLDLFTHYGTFWTAIDDLRHALQISPAMAVPPEEPGFHAEVVGLMDRWTMPERFHIPDGDPLARPAGPLSDDDSEAMEAAQAIMDELASPVERMVHQIRISMFLNELRAIWKHEVARPHEQDGDWRHGGNVLGWMSWAPFLSACIKYDPPPDRLLKFAEHDDHVAAALRQRTFSQDGDAREQAGVHRSRFLAGVVSALDAYGDALRDSYFESGIDVPRGKRGQPKLDALLEVQCAVWRHNGTSSADIGRCIDRGVRDNADTYGPGSASYRERSDAAERAVQRGRHILDNRDAWARITGE